MSSRFLVPLVLLCTAGLAAAQETPEPDAAAAAAVARPPKLTAESLPEIRARVLPSERESVWLAVGWRPSFWEAVVEAQAAGRPVLLWAMNGHPLACT